MFASISLAGLKDSQAFAYAANVPFFQGRKALAFKPGLNVLVGPNGCGKSTVLQMLGRTMCATQGGVSVVTESALSDNVDMMARIGRDKGRMRHKVGLKVKHDGQPVVFCDPRNRTGLTGGALDDDFFHEGLRECLQRGSHGQTALGRLNPALAILMGDAPFPAAVEQRVQRKNVNSMWAEALDVLEAAMAGSEEPGQRTILLDEPEANFSLVWQSRLWRRLADPKVAERFQVIVATHSAFALGIGHAHYIDFVEGFRDEAEATLRARFAGPAA
jgi:predicted ATPase